MDVLKQDNNNMQTKRGRPPKNNTHKEQQELENLQLILNKYAISEREYIDALDIYKKTGKENKDALKQFKTRFKQKAKTEADKQDVKDNPNIDNPAHEIGSLYVQCCK